MRTESSETDVRAVSQYGSSGVAYAPEYAPTNKSSDIAVTEITPLRTAELNPPQTNLGKLKQVSIAAVRIIFGPTSTSNRRRCWWTGAFFLATSYLMCISNVLCEIRFHPINSQILPDLGFDFADAVTPMLVSWVRFPDTACVSLSAFTVGWLCFTCQQRTVKLRRFFVIISLLYLGRSLCLMCTQLPNPCPGYASDESWTQNVFKEAFWVWIRRKQTSQDVFYSGHSVMMTMYALTVDTYSPHLWLRGVVWCAVIFSLYMLIATRFHYTIDVLVAVFLTVLLWKLYHLALRSEDVHLEMRIFRWLEGDILEESGLSLLHRNRKVMNDIRNHRSAVVADAHNDKSVTTTATLSQAQQSTPSDSVKIAEN